jgi:hypothetical protein
MTNPIDRLAEIQKRADAATSGPWCTDSWEIYQGAEYVPGISEWIGETCRGATTMEQDRADAAFVAAARDDVPFLLAEVAELRDQLATSERQNAEMSQQLTAIRHLHKDSPMGPCPVCVDADALARGGDYTVPYPCPTARVAGATECEPKGATA